MADQSMAQDSALKGPMAENRNRPSVFPRRIRNAWRVARCWARYLIFGGRLGVPGLIDFIMGNHFFPSCQLPSELTALGEILAALRPKCALEMGTAQGGTLLFLTKLASPNATILSIDLPSGKFGGGYTRRRGWFYMRFAHRRQRVHLLRGDSHANEILGHVKGVLPGGALDYVFIDGDHSYEGVRQDFETYAPLVRRGGVIAFHDIAEGPPQSVGGVPRFWREVKSRYRHTELIWDRNQVGYGIGVLYIE